VRAAAQAGASSVTPIVLHLRPGAREWFFGWLGEHHPGLIPRYRALYGRGAYAPKAYQQQVADRVRALARQYRVGQDRPGRDRPGRNGTPRDPAGRDRAGRDRSGRDRAGWDRAGQGGPRPVPRGAGTAASPGNAGAGAPPAPPVQLTLL